MNTNTLAAALVGFLLGGLTVSIAAELESDDSPAPSHGSSNHQSSSRHSPHAEPLYQQYLHKNPYGCRCHANTGVPVPSTDLPLRRSAIAANSTGVWIGLHRPILPS